MSEAGYPDVDVLICRGIFTPAKTPPAIVKKLEVALAKAVADSKVQAKLKAMDVNPGGASGDEFRRTIDAEIKKYVEIVKAANLTFE
jgi:tripartite-type tricarboxylate transporter receptor subunit TctC